jgi:hypothetical protein
VTVSQEALLDAVHVHPVGRVTATEPCAPAAATEAPVGAMAAVQTTPACVTVNVWPPAVIVPVRGDRLVFAATLKFTVPSPDPLAPDVMVSHDADVDAVHAQPVSVSTLTLPLVAAAGTEAVTGAMAKLQACPAWVTVKVWPAIVIVPVRAEVDGLAVTLYATWPLPLPVAPPVTVIQDALLVAVHAQPEAAVTPTAAEPAADPSVAPTEESVKVQDAASCVTVKVRPAIVTVPVRGLVLVLTATEYPTLPLPLPEAPEVMVIQDALLVAVHAQPVIPVTATEPVAAAAETVVAPGEMENVQPPACVTVNVCPAMLSEPDRCVVLALAATE